MKINTFFTLITSLSFCWASAQLNDSIFIPNHQNNQFIYDKLWENPTQFNQLKLKDFTETGLNYTYKENSLKRVQTAEKTNQTQFSSKGIFQINPNLKLLGDFNYEFITEKNIGYVLSNQRTENSFVLNPNYLFVKKNSNWQNQNYALRGGAIYQLKNFNWGVTANYKNQSAFRKSDPRPEINSAEYAGDIFTAFSFKKHQISLFGGLGTKKDNHNVMAVNEYINAPANDDYFVRFSNGYGRQIYFSSFSKFLYKTNSQNFGTGYRFLNNNNAFFANYQYKKTMENLYARDANGNLFFDDALISFKYRVISHQADFSYLFQKKDNLFSVELELNSLTGDNYNVIEKGQNYRMTLDEASLKSIYQKTDNDRVKWGLITLFSLQDFSAIDLLGVTEKKIMLSTLSLKANRDVLYSADSKLNIEAGINAYFPWKTSLSYTKVSSTNVIYDGVIKKDHAFDETEKITPEIGLFFYKKINKKNQIKVFTQWRSVFALNHNHLNSATNYNGKPNFIINTGVSLFY